MKQSFICLVILLFSVYAYGQQDTQVRGNVVNAANNMPVSGVLVTINGQGQSTTTNAMGEFHFMSAAPGEYVVTFSSPQISEKETSVNINPNTILLMKDVKVVVLEVNRTQDLVGISDESILDDDGITSQEVSSMVVMSNDPYLKNVAYQLSPLRFKVRGYSNIYEQKYINGVSFNDQNRGVFNFASVGALNDLTRNGDVINYQTPSTFSYGSIGGTENINMRAGSYAKGSKVTLSYTNRIYYLRGMASFSTGMQDNGWAFTGAVGGRYSDEGMIEGTFYRNVSYAFAAEKQLKDGKHSISFTTFGSPVQRGQQSASFQEAYDLTGNNLYNPNWGWYKGDKRNSKVVTAYDPTAVLSHIWKISEDMNLTTGVGAHYARYGNTALNWYNAPDPRPDYYRYLPSYHAENLTVFDYYTELWRQDPSPASQINWYDMYRANELASLKSQGALYMVEERRSDLFEASLNSTLNVQMGKGNTLTAGIGLRKSQSKQFKTVDDLLGSKFVLDIDKFAERDFPGDGDVIQNDLNNPNRKVYKGDVFGYDFRLNINSANAWVQNQYRKRLFDFYYAAKITYTSFQRDGKMKNGRYQDNSYGKGKTHTFVDLGLKAGVTYKITGRHLVSGNVSYATEAPLPNNAYISPRISDNTIENLESGRVFSADLSYIFSLPSLKGRLSVYQTNFSDQMSKISYYHDAERTFVNHILSNMSKVNRGIELGAAYKINTSWSVDFAGTIAEYYYSNNPDGVISYENGKESNIKETVHFNNYYQGGTPQIAGTLGINYFYKYWFFNLNINGFGRSYIEISPLRRLSSNYVGLNPNKPEDMETYRLLTNQEQFDEGYTIDLSIGKVLYLPKSRAINVNLSFNNITNRKNIVTGGYEQGRLDITAPKKFASKYYYMQGFNCFLNVSYRF